MREDKVGRTFQTLKELSFPHSSITSFFCSSYFFTLTKKKICTEVPSKQTSYTYTKKRLYGIKCKKKRSLRHHIFLCKCISSRDNVMCIRTQLKNPNLFYISYVSTYAFQITAYRIIRRELRLSTTCLYHYLCRLHKNWVTLLILLHFLVRYKIM